MTRRISFVLSAAILASACGDNRTNQEGTEPPGAPPSGRKRAAQLGADENTAEKHVCDAVFLDASGRLDKDGNPLPREKFVNVLQDPLIHKAFLGVTSVDECPTSYQEILERLRKTDTSNCNQFFGGIVGLAPNEAADPAAAEADKKAREGLLSAFISETAQVIGELSNGAGYRTVTTRNCDGRQEFGLLFSLFGLRAQDKELPGVVEIIAHDEASGVFNFYQAFPKGSIGSAPNFEGIVFFGNSVDMVAATNQPGFESEGEDPGLTVRRCAKCHQNGGLIQKELPAPWLHWEGDFRLPEGGETPGVTEILANNPDLGQRANGITVEGLVRSGNSIWNQARLRALRNGGTVKDILRPLFCSREVNIGNAASQFSPADGLGERQPTFADLQNVPSTPFLDQSFNVFQSFQVRPGDYDAVIKANGQRLERSNGQVLKTPQRDKANQLVKGADGKLATADAVDTVFDLYFVERAGIDDDWVRLISQRGIVDEEFVRDVLMVDFTRPVFSDDRCALLAFAPDIPNAQLIEGAASVRDQIRDGFIANMQNAAAPIGAAGETLLANLKNTDDKLAHTIQVGTYLNACSAKIVKNENGDVVDSKPFLQAIYPWISAARRRAQHLAAFEFAGNRSTMPVDNLQINENTLRLSPLTCEATNEFVSPAPVVIEENFDACVNQKRHVDEVAEGKKKFDPEKGPIVCQSGVAALDSSCHKCVTAVCTENSFCCDTQNTFSQWGGFCRERLEQFCGKLAACPAGSGDEGGGFGGPIIGPFPFPGPVIPFQPAVLVDPAAIPEAARVISESEEARSRSERRAERAAVRRSREGSTRALEEQPADRNEDTRRRLEDPRGRNRQ